jgi:uncharacterized phage protein (TIGR01671 family)
MIPAIGITEDGTPFTMTSVYKEKVGDELRKQNASCMAYSKEEIVLMQFTGLLDKNGKDIYEGDILKRVIDVPNSGSNEFIEVVEFVPGIFQTRRLNDPNDNGTYLGEFMFHTIEVIGNTYEHPQLLNPNTQNKKV